MEIGLEPAEAGVMRRPPQSPSDGVFSQGLARQIIWIGFLIGLVNLFAAWWALSSHQEAWQTIVMSTVVLLQVVQVHVSRSASASVFKKSPLTNRALVFSTIIILFLQALVIYLPPLQLVFGTASLSAQQLSVPLLAGLFVLLVVEVTKKINRKA